MGPRLGKLDTAEAQAQWQYEALEALRTDPDVIASLGWSPPDLRTLADVAQSERGFGRFLAISMRRHLCGDPQVREALERDIDAARRDGVQIRTMTPGVIGASVAGALAQFAGHLSPELQSLGTLPLTGAFFMIYSIGLDAFCDWISDRTKDRNGAKAEDSA